MEIEEFMKRIKPKLKSAYGQFGIFSTEMSVETWFEMLKGYEIGDVEFAVKAWIKKNRFKPTPAELIELIPMRPGETMTFGPKWENVQQPDGSTKLVQTYRCTRCHDYGLIMTEDAEGHVFGEPCTCPIGRYRYRR